MTLTSLLRSTRSSVARLFSGMPAAEAAPKQKQKQSGVESREPPRFSSRLKDGRALAQDVWSIYKSVSSCSPIMGRR